MQYDPEQEPLIVCPSISSLHPEQSHIAMLIILGHESSPFMTCLLRLQMADTAQSLLNADFPE